MTANIENASSSQLSSKLKPAAPADWLPLSRARSTLSQKSLRRGNIQALQHRDWFMAFASTIATQDSVQSKMVGKFYLFLRDFIPQGLQGSFGHIYGNQVMTQLLCHANESTVSRHRVTKYAEAAFSELERWMDKSKNKTWREARDASEKNRSARKKPTGKAPGLHSPAALMAVLIIGHPDPTAKFRSWIGRLEVDWMIRPRGDLDVRQGFWKGVNSDNLSTIFIHGKEDEEIRKAKVALLADYNQLFGRDFLRCRRDIRPYLPETLSGQIIPLTEEPLYTEDEDEGGFDNVPNAYETSDKVSYAYPSFGNSAADVPVIQDAEKTPITTELVLQFRECLTGEVASQGAEAWLIGQLQKANPLLRTWCAYWENRIDLVTSYQDQMIIRSLFNKSLRSLRQLHASRQDWMDGYMVVEIAEDNTWWREQDVSEAQSVLVNLPQFAPCAKANRKLKKLIGKVSPDLRNVAEEALSKQLLILGASMQEVRFFNYWKTLLAVEALYTSTIIQGYYATVNQDKVQSWPNKHQQTKLFDKETIDMLKLTAWQVRALLVPGSFPQVLTEWQKSVFLQNIGPESESSDVASLNELILPAAILNASAYPNAIEAEHSSLHKLLGELEPVKVATSSTSTNLVSTSVKLVEAETSSAVPNPASASVLFSPAEAILRPGARALSVPKSVSVSQSTTPSFETTQERGPKDKVNRFAGKSYHSTKRAGSPLTGGRPKVSRLNTWDKVTEEIQTFRLDAKLEIDQLKEGVKDAGKVTHRLEEEVEQLKQSSKQWQDSQAQLTEQLLRQKDDTLATIKRLLEEHIAEVALGTRDILHDAIQTQTDQILATVSPPKTKPLPGQDGYLAQCIAPPGYGYGQRKYESMLLRAAWLYIHMLGDPDQGVTEDEGALADVLATFPQADEDHIIVALDHVHMQAYGKLFS